MMPIRTGALLLAVAAVATATAGSTQAHAAATAAPTQLTAPLGSTKGSFIDASQVYGSVD